MTSKTSPLKDCQENQLWQRQSAFWKWGLISNQFLCYCCNKNHVTKLLKGHNINANLFIKVLMVACQMHRNYFVTKKIEKDVVLTPKIPEMMCKQFHFSHTTIANIIQDYILHRRIFIFLHRRIYMSGKYFMGKSKKTNEKQTKILVQRVSWLWSNILFVNSVCTGKG